MTHYQSLMLKHRFIYVLTPIQQDSKWNSFWIGNVDIKKVVRKDMKKKKTGRVRCKTGKNLITGIFSREHEIRIWEVTRIHRISK